MLSSVAQLRGEVQRSRDLPPKSLLPLRQQLKNQPNDLNRTLLQKVLHENLSELCSLPLTVSM